MNCKVEDCKKIKAYHEAGHATIAHHHNFRIRKVEVYPTKQLITHFVDKGNGCKSRKIEEEIRINKDEIRDLKQQEYTIRYRGCTSYIAKESMAQKKYNLVAGFVGEYIFYESEKLDLFEALFDEPILAPALWNTILF